VAKLWRFGRAGPSQLGAIGGWPQPSPKRELDAQDGGDAQGSGWRLTFALEQLLVDRVVVCWMQMSFYDTLIAQTHSYTPAQGRMLQQQQDSAHRRYLASMKILATIRKLLTPVRSPVEIASKFSSGKGSGLRLREAPVETGVPVEN
jgi:hypothetical protein